MHKSIVRVILFFILAVTYVYILCQVGERAALIPRTGVARLDAGLPDLIFSKAQGQIYSWKEGPK